MNPLLGDRLIPEMRAKVRADLGDPVDRTPIARPRWETRYRNLAVLLDALMAVGAGALALLFRFGVPEDGLATAWGPVPYVAVVAGLVVVWVLLLAGVGAYDRRRLGMGLEEYRRVLAAGVHLLALVAVVTFAFRLDPSRAVVFLVIPLLVVATIVARYLYRQWIHRQRAQGHAMRRVVVVGTSAGVADLVRHLRGCQWAGFEVVAAITAGMETAIEVDGHVVKVGGDVTDTRACVEANRADVVAIADPTILPDGFIRDLSWSLTGRGVDLVVAPALADVAGPRISTVPVAGLPLVHVEEPQLSGWSQVFKGVFDRSTAAAALVLLAPLFLAVAVAIKLTDRGPVFFRQTRVGRQGESFEMIKFRTMVPGAEARLEEVRDLNNHDADHVLFKAKDDPRITPVGRLLRRWSLDELPQFVHVVKGEMSLVGPRPPLPSEVMAYDQLVTRRLLVKPGMTGLWQVSGRADLDWDEAVRIDLHYVDHWSLSFDLAIIAKTITAVIKGRGAY